MGIGVVFLNFGLKILFNIPEGLAAQTGLVVLAVLVATISAVSGVDKGIRRLSELNVLLALGLAGFILVTGQTIFLLNAVVLNIGDYVSNFAGLTMQTFAFDRPTGWLNRRTLFFWAWWVAWASFVGCSSPGSTRAGRSGICRPDAHHHFYTSCGSRIFGNSAIEMVRAGTIISVRLR